MNTAPRGDLNVEDSRMTVERLQHKEDELALTGERRPTAFAQHRATGALVGHSELFWPPGRESVLMQGATGVQPAHHRHRLGRWLKAANLRASLVANPQARVVRTGNADSNEGMLAINDALGFKAFMAQTNWQVDTAKVRAWLNARSEATP